MYRYDGTRARFPANLIFDPAAAEMLDRQGRPCLSSSVPRRCSTKTKNAAKGKGHAGLGCGSGDRGGASRFFYTAKAVKREKGAFNDHRTVKPLALMRYLLTLLSTPSGGTILDPFAGSGSTLVAAKSLGRRAIGVELKKHYCDIAVRRLEDQNDGRQRFGDPKR